MGFSQRNADLYSPNVNVAQNNISGNRNWNANQDTDINVNNYQGYHGGAGAAYGEASAGSVTNTLPAACSQTYAGGTVYYNCGGRTTSRATGGAR
jgi:hypothetical protein